MSLLGALEDRRVCVCAGAGGVGKTTVSAAVALGLAARGQTVAVVTIDPARRLADALGVGELGNEPLRVDAAPFAAHGVEIEGELWAMMLDPKRTLDDLIGRLAPSAAARDAILDNRLYRELSTAVGGSQEFGAVAKLHELVGSGRFDAVVLDTPPARNALDFLDAPARLLPFLHGRAMRALVAPTGRVTAVAARGTGLAVAALRRLTGAAMMDDLRDLLDVLGEVADGLSTQASEVERLLADPATAFLLVTSPKRLAIDEAVHFAGRLEAMGGTLTALVVNRFHPRASPRADVDPAALADDLGGDARLAEQALGALVDLRALADRDARGLRHLAQRFGAPHTVTVPDLEPVAHDAAGLAAVHRHLAADRVEEAALLRQVGF